ncbi:MAG: serine/threonine-protein kinase [Vicinamibacterales bacterium]
MTPEEWQRARQILEVAISCPPAERDKYIAAGCGENARLREELQSMLARYELGPSLDLLRATADAVPAESPSPDSDESLDRTRPAPAGGDPSPVLRHPHGAATERWGGFALLEEVGRGGFGVVYRAWDSSLKREIALKVIDIRRLTGAREDTVLREGQMLARVRHPNVVTVYSAQQIGRDVGLAMEYIKGWTLSNLVVQQGPSSPREAIAIGIDLCGALAAVHGEGLVHRDLKASNVMRESGGRIVLMDFGAGRELHREPGTWSDLHGTPLYMSPEVLRGSRATPASDVYSLGVLLFYLVTGRYPLSGARFEDVLRAHGRGARLALAECRSDLPDSFVAVVERALHVDATQRPQTAAALKRELSDAGKDLSKGNAIRRIRKRTDRDSQVDQTREVDPPRPFTDVLQRSVVSIGGAVLLCGLVGFVTTVEFNGVLGRTGGFASESPVAYISWGAKALLGPAVYIGIALLLFNMAMLAARITGAVMPCVPAPSALAAWVSRNVAPPTGARRSEHAGAAAHLLRARGADRGAVDVSHTARRARQPD